MVRSNSREALAHPALLRADRVREPHDVRFVRELRHPAEELVARELELLVGVGMRGKLRRGVGLQPREKHEPDAARPHHRLLDGCGRGSSRSERIAHRTLVVCRFLEVSAEQLGDLLIAREARRTPQLH